MPQRMTGAGFVRFAADPIGHLTGWYALPLPLVAAVSAVALVAWYYVAVGCGVGGGDRKARAWILTLQSSTVMSSSALIFCTQWYVSFMAHDDTHTTGVSAHESVMIAQTVFSTQMCT